MVWSYNKKKEIVIDFNLQGGLHFEGRVTPKLYIIARIDMAHQILSNAL